MRRSNRFIATALTALLMFSNYSKPASAAEEPETSPYVEASENMENSSPTPVYTAVSDVTELSETVGSDWSSFFSTAVIDPEQHSVTVDGQEVDPEVIFGEDAGQEAAMESLGAALSYFDDPAYETSLQDDGTLEVTSPYQMKRVVVYAEELEDYCGAVSVIHFPEASEYILEYETPEQTKKAYDRLKDVYGFPCYVDKIVDCDLFETDSFEKTWGYQHMGFQNVLSYGGSANKEPVSVAVIDTGVDAQHEMFAGGRISEESYDFVRNTENMTDSSGHGTHIAGIIAQCTPENVTMVVMRVFDDSGRTSWLTLNNALQYSIDCHADVINMSLGITSNLYVSTETALNYKLDECRAQGIPVLCASGNEGLNVEHVYPACYDSVIAVSAINEASEFADSFYGGGGGSGYGDKIEFCAPGVDIVSALNGGGVCTKTGTSCATAFVSAAFAILTAEAPGETIDYIYEKAVSRSVDLGETGRDPYYGWGVIHFEGEETPEEPEDDGVYPNTLGKTGRGDLFNLANNIKVTWKEVPGAKYYKIYRSGVKDPVIVTSRLVGWDKEPGLVNGRKYTYKIVASLTGKEDASGDSPLSYSKVIYRLKTVAIRSVKNTAPGTVTVRYDKTTGGDSYVLRYSEREDMAGVKTKVVRGANNTTCVIGGLKKGKTYYISIRVRKKVNGIDYYTTFGVPKKIKVTQGVP